MQAYLKYNPDDKIFLVFVYINSSIFAFVGVDGTEECSLFAFSSMIDKNG
jgi:hypothetical protein